MGRSSLQVKEAAQTKRVPFDIQLLVENYIKEIINSS